MSDRPVEIRLEAAGVEPVRVMTTLHFYPPGERLRRIATILLIALLLAVSLFPIPIIHLIGPPLILVAGIVTAVRQSRATARLQSTRIACPKCSGINRVGGGLGLRDPALPITQLCEHCRRVLTLTIDQHAGDAASPPSG